MSLTTQVEAGRRAAVRRLAGAAVAGALAVGLFVALLGMLFAGHRSPPPATPTGRPAPVRPAPSAVPSTAGIWTVPPVSAGPLLLPHPAVTTQGVALGYPHSTAGAISAAARYAEEAVGLDTSRAATVARLTAAPSYLTAAADLTAAVAAARQVLGLPLSGATGGAYLLLQAKGYRVADATPDRVVVAILGLAEGAGPATGGWGRTSATAATHTLVWASGDWRIAAAATPVTEPAPWPGTTQAYQQGWRDLAIP